MTVSRFTAILAPTGYEVFDRECRQFVKRTDRWMPRRARTIAAHLNDDPSYAVTFEWTEPERQAVAS